MKTMKKMLALLLCAVLILGMFAGCGNTTNQEETKGSDSAGTTAKKSITVGYPASLESIGPFITSNSIYKMVMGIFYMQLGSLNLDGELESNLYSSVEETSDGHYVVKLYENIYDTAGNHITAHDVAFSYNTAKSMGTSQTYNMYTNATATSDYTFEFDMTTNALLAFEGVMSQVNIVDEEAYVNSGDEMNTGTAVSCGPYKIAEFVPGSHITFQKVDNFWCEDMSLMSCDKQANIDEITIKCITENAQLAIALNEGSIDAAVSIPGLTAQTFEGNSAFNVSSVPSNLYYGLYFDMREGHIFENEDLRKAVCYAVDQEEVMYGALQGFGIINKGHGSQNGADYNKAWNERNYYETDLEKAAEYMKKAGYEPGELNITLMCQWEQTKPAAEVVQQNLAAIGINAEILCPDQALFSSYQDCTSDVWDLNLMFWVTGIYVGAGYTGQLDLDNRSNDMLFFGLKDQNLQALVKVATNPDTHSQESVDAVQAYLDEHALVYDLYSPYNYYVYDSGIEQIFVNARDQFLPNCFTYSDSYGN